MKNKMLLLAWMCCTVLLASCGKDDPVPEPALASRTVLVYFAADNNLTKFAAEDLEEMKEGLGDFSGSNIHLLVYMDDGDSPCLMELKKNKRGEVVEEVLKEYGERNSTGYAETTEVFRDVFQNSAYQAESYGLVYWSHCDGWIPYPVPSSRWIGQDKGDGDNRMNLDDFIRVLDGAPHFDFILFDACFMQSVEVAYALRNHTDYYMASPTETPGPGVPYDRIFSWMFTPNAAVQMADAYFKVYEAKYNGGIGISNSNWTGGASICAVRTNRLEQLATATRQALSQLAPVGEEVRLSVFDYDQRSNGQGHIGYYDMAGMMEALLDGAAYASWKQAFDAAIAYWNTTEMNYSAAGGMFSMEGANGVTHYIPASVASPAAEAYRSTEWYSAAGLSVLGW